MDNDQRRRSDDSKSHSHDMFERALDEILGPAPEPPEPPPQSEESASSPDPSRPASSAEGTPAQVAAQTVPRVPEISVPAPQSQSLAGKRATNQVVRNMLVVGVLLIMLAFAVCAFGALLFNVVADRSVSTGAEPLEEVVLSDDVPEVVDPPVPLGSWGDLGNGWLLRVDDVVYDADELVLSRSTVKESRVGDRQFLVVSVTVRNLAAESRIYEAGFRLRLHGRASDRRYRTFEEGTYCGILRDRFDHEQIPGS